MRFHFVGIALVLFALVAAVALVPIAHGASPWSLNQPGRGATPLRRSLLTAAGSSGTEDAGRLARQRRALTAIAVVAMMVTGGIGAVAGIAHLTPTPGTSAAVGAGYASPPATTNPIATPISPPSVAPAAGSSASCPATPGTAADSAAAAAGPASSPPSGAGPGYNAYPSLYASFTGPYGYVAAGASLRDQGYGTIDLTTSGPIVRAYLVWEIMSNSVPSAAGTLNGASIHGTWVAYASPSPCWSPQYIYVFAADVTPWVVSGANHLTGFPSGIVSGADPWASAQVDPMAEGASLIVIEQQPGGIHQVSVYVGALTESGSGITAPLSFAPSLPGMAETTYIVADGQVPGNWATWDGTPISTNAFPGRDPKATSTPWSDGNLSDTLTLAAPVGAGNTWADVGISSAASGDCLTWSGQVVSVPVAPAPPPYIVQFSEKGLPAGTVWGVSFAGVPRTAVATADGSTITFAAENGSYPYSILPIPGYATPEEHGIAMVQGGSLFLQLPFHPVQYAVTVTESGLPLAYGVNLRWSVILNGSEFGDNPPSSGTPSIGFALPNGTYQFNLTTNIPRFSPVPPSGFFVVAGAALNVSVVFQGPPLYPVTFVVSGLPSGAEWTVEVPTSIGLYSASTTNRSVVMDLPNGTISIVALSAGFGPVSLTISVSGTPLTVGLPFAQVYEVIFLAEGLPQEARWGVNLNGSVNQGSEDRLTFEVANGTYPFQVLPPHGYQATPMRGNVTVSGGIVVVSISLSLPAGSYSVVFTETGLPSGTEWFVVVQGAPVSSNTTSLTLPEPNGTYQYAVRSTVPTVRAPPGEFVVQGANVTVPIVFAPVLFALSFEATGLPNGTTWWVNLTANQSTRSDGSSANFLEINGTYSYQISGPGYAPSPAHGLVVVNGAPVTVAISFTPVRYLLTVTESGLPATGTPPWSLTIDDQTLASSGPTITTNLTNGSYPFHVSAPGYQPTPASGEVSVRGAPASLAISFSTVVYTVTFVEQGLPSAGAGGWSVNVSGQATYTSSTPELAVVLANGSYTFTAASTNPLYTALGGSLDVQGQAVEVTVMFEAPPAQYAAYFNESGLATGLPWQVTVGGNVYASVQASIVVDLTNGTYNFSVSAVLGYLVGPSHGELIIQGASTGIPVLFTPEASLALSVTPSVALVTLNGAPLPGDGGTYALTLPAGPYYVNATLPGYTSYSDLVVLVPGQSVVLSIVLTAIPQFGTLTGTISPSNAILLVDGHAIPVQGGVFDQSLVPGSYFLSAMASGYAATVVRANITSGETTVVHLSLQAQVTVTLSGTVRPANASVLVDGIQAYVNSTGFYQVYTEPGVHTLSVWALGYFAESETLNLTTSRQINVVLTPTPAVTSEQRSGNTSASGYNVTITTVENGAGSVSINFTASANGTLVVTIPYSDIANSTIAEVLASRVYIDGTQYANFTIAISSDYTVILTVRGLAAGDPQLYWAAATNATPPPPPPPPPGGTTSAPGSPWLLVEYLLIGLGVAAAITGAGLLYRRRGRAPRSPR